mgnify:CR=1 FL=1
MRRFKNILCVIDPESATASHTTLEQAVNLAENNQTSLTVLEVTPRVTAGIGMLVPGELQTAAASRRNEAHIASLIEPYRQRLHIQHKVLFGTSFLEVIREVLRCNFDLVIKCAESPDWMDRFIAGDDMHLLRKCPCPVWLIKPGEQRSYKRILAAVDVDDSYPPSELATRHALNTIVMELAASLAMSEFAQLHVVYTWEANEESAMRHAPFMTEQENNVDTYIEQVQRHHTQRMDELMHEVGAKLGSDAIDYLKPQLHLLQGSARKEIPALAKHLQVDCIVMGTVARTGVRGFIMGNTAEKILGQIDCSVIAVKPPGFVTPITLED